MKLKIVVSLLIVMALPVGQVLISGCTPCREAQDYRVDSASSVAHRITEKDNIGFFSEPLALGDDVRWDSLVVFILPNIQLLSESKQAKGTLLPTAYACDPGVSLPTQQVTDIKIFFNNPISVDGEVHSAGEDLSEHFMIYDFFLGTNLPVIQYLEETNKQIIIQGMYFTLARSFDNVVSGALDIQITLDGANIVGSETIPITIRSSL